MLVVGRLVRVTFGGALDARGSASYSSFLQHALPRRGCSHLRCARILFPPPPCNTQWIHIDEMRTLLEIHYDSVHFERWKNKDGKAPLRRSDYHVFKSTINAHRKKLCQRLALPKDVKSILQVPRHEDDPHKLEELRGVILREVEGEEFLLVDTKA